MGEMCFSAAIEDKQLKFLVKIPIIYVHLRYTLFCPSVCRSWLKRQKPNNFSSKRHQFSWTILIVFSCFVWIIINNKSSEDLWFIVAKILYNSLCPFYSKMLFSWLLFKVYCWFYLLRNDLQCTYNLLDYF